MNALEVHKSLGEHILADGMKVVMDIEKSHDCYLVDARDGNEYLDMFSMYASTAVGYNHPYIVRQKNFLGEMAVNKPSISDMYNVHFAEFVETFERVAIPKELPHLFFISGGALAVENALKVAFDWKTRKNFEKGIKKEAGKVIHFEKAFHGRSGYTLSLTNTADPRKYMYFPKFDWPRIISPALQFPITPEVIEKTMIQEEKAITQILTAIQENSDEIAALIIEPIQSEGGDRHFRNEFFEQLRNICDEHEIFLIFDEVQTGIGITGKMWAYEHTGIIPDALAFGKKTQVCGILVSDRVNDVKNNVFEESSRINSTFGGNFIDMMRFKMILEIIEKDMLIAHAQSIGEYLLDKIYELQNDFPQLVSNARGKGLLCAFDLPNEQIRKNFLDNTLERKLLILKCGENSIRFRPHLIVTKQHIDESMQIIYQSLKALD